MKALVGAVAVAVVWALFPSPSPAVCGNGVVEFGEDCDTGGGGIDITAVASPQAVVSPTFPARDRNGATSGDGVWLFLEVSPAVGAGTPTITITYTNCAGTGSRTATNQETTLASTTAGIMYNFNHAGGDLGVRSVESIALSATWTSGTINLDAAHPIAVVDTAMGGDGGVATWDAVSMGLSPL